VLAVSTLRKLRRTAELSQQPFASLIDVPLNTFRMWDSGLRPTPPHLLERATIAALEHARDTELVSLDNLARLDSRQTPIASMGSAADVSDSRHPKAPCPEAVSERFARPMARPRAPGEECPRRAQL